MPQLRQFLVNTFILDEHRSNLVPMQSMKNARADHALHNEGDLIYVLGGVSYRDNGGEETGQLMSLNSCEIYDIKNDEWSDMACFEHAR